MTYNLVDEPWMLVRYLNGCVKAVKVLQSFEGQLVFEPPKSLPFPHVCGGYPIVRIQESKAATFSPHQWGLFRDR